MWVAGWRGWDVNSAFPQAEHPSAETLGTRNKTRSILDFYLGRFCLCAGVTLGVSLALCISVAECGDNHSCSGFEVG